MRKYRELKTKVGYRQSFRRDGGELIRKDRDIQAKVSLLHRLIKIGGALSASFGILTSTFWILLCFGSWHDVRNISHTSGCIEFNLRPSITGHNISSNQKVFTDYMNGYVLGNIAFFDFKTFRPNVSDVDDSKGLLFWLPGRENEKVNVNEQVKAEHGTARISINPLTMSFNLYYKIYGFGDWYYPKGYREIEGVRFSWQSSHCP